MVLIILLLSKGDSIFMVTLPQRLRDNENIFDKK